jgi:hypothetical protein
MKIFIEGNVADLGNIDISKVKETSILLRTDKGVLVLRPMDGKVTYGLKTK